jgi:hypothetical protein
MILEATENEIENSRRRRIYFAICFASALALLHFTIRRFIPSFSVLYNGPERPDWIPITIGAEFILHLIYLGALLAVTGRSVLGLSKSAYSDDGTKSLLNSSGPIETADWRSIMTAWVCVPIYLVLWMLAYGYL